MELEILLGPHGAPAVALSCVSQHGHRWVDSQISPSLKIS